MARKKSEKGILINGLDVNHIVEKSRPLVLMRAVDFSLGELRVLDTYLSRINARDPKTRIVRFSKEEYENLMGVERVRSEDFKKLIKMMMKHTVTVPRPNDEWDIYNLFEMASFKQDKSTAQWWVELMCTQEAKKLFFNIEHVGYLRYQLKNVLSLSSKYSVLLYIYLLDNRFRGTWTVSVESLKKNVFQCDKVEYYADYRNFNRKVLSKALSEVNTNTDIEFEMKPIRTGRIITDIEFHLVKDAVLEEMDPNQQLSLFEEAPPENESEELALLADMTDNRFTFPEYQMFLELMRHNDRIEKDAATNSMIWGRARYLHAQYQYLLTAEAKKPVKHPFNYLKKAVTDDYAGVLK